MRNNVVTHNQLSDIAGITKFVPQDNQMLSVARSMGISLGD